MVRRSRILAAMWWSMPRVRDRLRLIDAGGGGSAVVTVHVPRWSEQKKPPTRGGSSGGLRVPLVRGRRTWPERWGAHLYPSRPSHALDRSGQSFDISCHAGLSAVRAGPPLASAEAFAAAQARAGPLS